MTALDHKAEANDWIRAATHVLPNTEIPDTYAALAQVNATLYLAEQQRRAADEQHLANVIAFTDAVSAGVRAGEKPSPLVWKRFESAGKQIVEGLEL